MKPCTPAIFTAAIFTALLVLDLIYKNYKDVGFHVAGGIFCVIGLYTACELGGEGMAWVLLGIPFLFLLIGLSMIWVDSQKQAPVATIVPTPSKDDCTCPYCHMCPCRCRTSCGDGGASVGGVGGGADPIYTQPPPPPSPPLGCPRKTA
jgi:hypothetical protein